MIQQFEQTINRVIEFALLTEEEENTVKKFLLWVEENLNKKTEYMLFIEEFNKITKKKYKAESESRELFYKGIAIHSLSDRIAAIKNALTDPWIAERTTILTPTWILKTDNTAKYMNYKPAKKTQDGSNNSTKDTEYDAL